MAKKVILDVDPHVDAAVALALALFDPELEVVAVTATTGCVAASQATRNVQAIIEQLDPPRLPRIGVASDTDSGYLGDLHHLYGKDGLAVPNLRFLNFIIAIRRIRLSVKKYEKHPTRSRSLLSDP